MGRIFGRACRVPIIAAHGEKYNRLFCYDHDLDQHQHRIVTHWAAGSGDRLISRIGEARLPDKHDP
jgi:hypothetical protein